MSFIISAAGHAPAAAAAIADDPVWASSDRGQVDRVKEYLAAELAAVPAGLAVLVDAAGHSDPQQHTVTITIRHITLAPDIPAEVEAPPDPQFAIP